MQMRVEAVVPKHFAYPVARGVVREGRSNEHRIKGLIAAAVGDLPQDTVITDCGDDYHVVCFIQAEETPFAAVSALVGTAYNETGLMGGEIFSLTLV